MAVERDNLYPTRCEYGIISRSRQMIGVYEKGKLRLELKRVRIKESRRVGVAACELFNESDIQLQPLSGSGTVTSLALLSRAISGVAAAPSTPRFVKD